MSSSENDTDHEYEQIRAKLDEFETIDSEIEDFENENYLGDIDASAPISIDDKSELKELGCVYSVVDGVLIVQSTHISVMEPGTVVALPNRTPIGIIGDTFGPVDMPFYSIKVKNEQLIPLLGDGLPVLFCPNSSRSFCVNDLQSSSDSDTEVEA